MPAEVVGSRREDLTIDFLQMPHSPIDVKMTWFATAADSVDYILNIRENGVLGRDAAICTDDALGKVFNPLIELDKYGRENPYADPSRGSFANVEKPAANDVIYR